MFIWIPWFLYVRLRKWDALLFIANFMELMCVLKFNLESRIIPRYLQVLDGAMDWLFKVTVGDEFRILWLGIKSLVLVGLASILHLLNQSSVRCSNCCKFSTAVVSPFE